MKIYDDKVKAIEGLSKIIQKSLIQFSICGNLIIDDENVVK